MFSAAELRAAAPAAALGTLALLLLLVVVKIATASRPKAYTGACTAAAPPSERLRPSPLAPAAAHAPHTHPRRRHPPLVQPR
jgi:hypothetical protein